MKTVLKKINDQIDKGKRFMVAAHINLEGDALGSMLSVGYLLKQRGKQVWLVNQDKTPDVYKFLPFVGEIKNAPPRWKPDVAILVDCSDISRIGICQDYLEQRTRIINIDHHISNTHFGHVNWVEPKASSACEMVYTLYKQFKIEIPYEVAICLYVGMFTDTGSFVYDVTNPYCHRAVADLMEKWRFSVYDIHHRIYEAFSFREIKLLGTVMQNFHLDRTGIIAWTEIPGWDSRYYRTHVDLTEEILSMLRAIHNVEIAILFKQVEGDVVRVNFRSRGKIDVNCIASYFGGGGHRSASGCTCLGSLAVVRKKVLKKAREVILDERGNFTNR